MSFSRKSEPRRDGLCLVHIKLSCAEQSCFLLADGAGSLPGSQVSANHRLDDNKAERARCEEAGREVSSSNVEGRPVGPLRVWPGGLNMSRSLGDFEVLLPVCPCAVMFTAKQACTLLASRCRSTRLKHEGMLYTAGSYCAFLILHACSTMVPFLS
jgi:hypothetical protein